jgi:hypothetical protein
MFYSEKRRRANDFWITFALLGNRVPWTELLSD